jgi:hypothetical protein
MHGVRHKRDVTTVAVVSRRTQQHQPSSTEELRPSVSPSVAPVGQPGRGRRGRTKEGGRGAVAVPVMMGGVEKAKRKRGRRIGYSWRQG